MSTASAAASSSKPSTSVSAAYDDGRGRTQTQGQGQQRNGSGSGSVQADARAGAGNGHQGHGQGQEEDEVDEGSGKKRKRAKRSMGKACVYCRRSIKREIPHLCRDFSPTRQNADGSHSHSHNPARSQSIELPEPAHATASLSQPNFITGGAGTSNVDTLQLNSSSSAALPAPAPAPVPVPQPAPGLYGDPNFPPTWPLLSEPSNPATFDGLGGSGGGNMGMEGWSIDDQTELGSLTKYLGDMRVPSLPGGFLDVLSYFDNGGQSGTNLAGVPMPGYDPLAPPSVPASGTQTPQYTLDRSGSISGGVGVGGAYPNNAGGPGLNMNQPFDAVLPGGDGLSGAAMMPQPSYALPGQAGPGMPMPGGGGGVGGGMGIAPGQLSGPGTQPMSTNMSRADSGGRSSGQGKGKGKETMPLGNLSRIERYFLAAADQPSGPRSSRLSQVIKAKYDAGLLRPYDYVKGYERMKGWMDSGRAAPRADSAAPSAPGSPVPMPMRGAVARTGLKPLTAAASGTGTAGASTAITPALGGGAKGAGISPESRRRIWAAMNGFRPKFRQIARTLTEVDLVFIEEAMERWMLQYDRAFASIHTPSCIWRRTGEIQKANQEFANLTGIPASMFRNGQLCVYELMDEDSAVRYWEGYAKIAFDAGQRSLYISCTLRIPASLTRLPPRMPFATPTTLALPKSAASGPGGGGVGQGYGQPGAHISIPELNLPQSLVNAANGPSSSVYSGETTPMPPGSGATATRGGETFREIRCCFSVTIRRDAWGVPVAIMGQWIPV